MPLQNREARGYTREWDRRRAEYLTTNPHCACHLALGERVPARIVDHVKPYKGDVQLFWDRNNWLALCEPCFVQRRTHG